jgi:hypothetical protein
LKSNAPLSLITTSKSSPAIPMQVASMGAVRPDALNPWNTDAVTVSINGNTLRSCRQHTPTAGAMSSYIARPSAASFHRERFF